jgi:hypothetical protein
MIRESGNLNDPQALPFRALVECLSHAAGQFLKRCRFITAPASMWPQTGPKALKSFRTSPFSAGDAYSLTSILARLLNVQQQQLCIETDGSESASSIRSTDLPLLRTHLKDLQQACLCVDCVSRSRHEHDVEQYAQYCQKDRFLDMASRLLGDAIALSLFDSLADDSDLLVLVTNGRGWSKRAFQTTVHSIFHTADGSDLTCEIESLLDWALALAGHDVEVMTPRHPRSR